MARLKFVQAFRASDADVLKAEGFALFGYARPKAWSAADGPSHVLIVSDSRASVFPAMKWSFVEAVEGDTDVALLLRRKRGMALATVEMEDTEFGKRPYAYEVETPTFVPFDAEALKTKVDSETKTETELNSDSES